MTAAEGAVGGNTGKHVFEHLGNEELLDEAGSSEWCWHKLNEAQQKFRNSIADAIGEGEQPSTSIDPFTLPTWTE